MKAFTLALARGFRFRAGVRPALAMFALLASLAPAAEIAGPADGPARLPASVTPGGPPVANPRLTGTPFMQVWRADDYGASPVNWRVLQHPTTGFIYVANNFGVMEFDGAVWRLIPMPHEGATRSLAVDRHGTVWAAGPGEICRLESDGTGTLRAVELTGRLPADDRVFGVINRTVATRDGLYLSGARRIFLFRDDGAVRVWRTEGDFSPIWALDDAVYVARDHAELVRLQPDGGAKVVFASPNPDEPLLRTYSAARDGDAWMLLTRFGPARWGGEGTPPARVAPESAALFLADPVRTTLQLANGRFALGTVHGAMILSHAGELEQRLDVTHGLPVDTINGFAEDREGGLWIAMQNGLARVQLDSPFALHGLPQGLDGGPRRMTRFHDRFYLAHGGGLSWRNPADGRFELVRGIRSGANRPVVVQDRLLVTTGTMLHEVRPDGTTTVVAPQNFLPLIEAKTRPGWLLAGDSDGLWLLAPTAAKPGWRVEGRLQHLREGVVQIYDTGDGFVWTVTDNGAIWRADFRAGLRLDAPCEPFGGGRGVPPARRRDHVQLFFLGDDLFAVGATWSLRYDAARERFAPAPPGTGVTTTADAIENVTHTSVWLHSSRPDSQVLHLALRPGARAGEAPGEIERFPAAALEGMVLNSLYYEPETRTLWLAGQGALVSMDRDWRSERQTLKPVALVRKFSPAGGAPLFGGVQARRPAALALAANQNSLRIEFASPTFTPDYIGNIHTTYRTRIDGLDAGWTPWSPEPFRDFTNLPYRRLVFRLQAQTADGRVSDETTFVFSIAPPWPLTPWAFAAYAAIALGGVLRLIAWRTRTHRHRAAQLESVVTTRTEELRRSNLELVRLHRLELDEKTAARLAEEKARLEVLRYQLNPHFLFNALTSVCAQLPPGLAGARATLERLTDFCQFTLFRPANDENPTLGQEMQMLTAYLDIERTRWGDLLEVTVDVEPAARDEKIPSLLLLPLIENALKYGQATTREKLRIRLAAHLEKSPVAGKLYPASSSPGGRPSEGQPSEALAKEGSLVIEVANTGQWVAPAKRGPVPSLGIGHENLRQRLQRYYPGAHEFTTTVADGWVTVRLRIGRLRPAE